VQHFLIFNIAQAVIVEESLKQCVGVETVQEAFFYDQSISCTGKVYNVIVVYSVKKSACFINWCAGLYSLHNNA